MISLLSPVFFQAIGNAKTSALLSLIRQLGCLIPIFWAFSKLGLVYTWIAFPAAEVITGVIGIVLYIRQIKNGLPPDILLFFSLHQFQIIPLVNVHHGYLILISAKAVNTVYIPDQ